MNDWSAAVILRDEFSTPLAKLQKGAAGGADALTSMGKVGGGLPALFADIGLWAGVGMGAAAAATARQLVMLDNLRQETQNTERALNAYAGDAASGQAAVEAFLRATDDGVSRLEAMRNVSQLLGMGLAETSEEVYSLTRMAALLGDKTLSVTDRMGSFNAMLANQSIERLDTFGISSGRVRKRIEELQAADANLAREQAFVNAVLEIGGEKLAAVEAAGVKAASALDEFNAATEDLKGAAAEFVNVEGAIRGVAGALRDLADMTQGASALRGALDSGAGVDAQLTAIEERLRYLQDLQARFAAGENLYRFNAAGNAAEIEALEVRAGNLRLYGQAADDVRAKLDAYLSASRDVGTAQELLNAAVLVGDEAQTAYSRASLQAAEELRAQALAAYQAAAGIARTASSARQSGTAFAGAYPSAQAYADALRQVGDAERRRNVSGPGSGNYAWYGGGSGSFYGSMWEDELAQEAAFATETRRLRDQRVEEERQAARTIANNYSKAYADIGSAAEAALLAGAQPSELDSLLTASGQYEDAPLEAGRRLAAIAQNGFAELQAHPDWAAMLKIPPEVLAGTNDQLRGWALQTQTAVMDLTRPDLIDWDAFIREFQEQEAGKTARENTINLAVSKLSAAGVMGGDKAQLTTAVNHMFGDADPAGALTAKMTGAGSRILADLRTEFDVGKPALLTAADTLGADLAARTVDAAEKGFGQLRKRLAATIAPEVAAILESNRGASALP